MNDIEVLARTIYGEARGEYAKQTGGLSSLIAVGNVIANRLLHPKKRFGGTITEICKKPFQFSCWNENDPNFNLLNNETITGDIFNLCLTVSKKTVDKSWPDLTKGSNHYHTDGVNPVWSQGQTALVKIGSHLFFKLN
jgi:N-acetylmuramoyl-L-alanine amidase